MRVGTIAGATFDELYPATGAHNPATVTFSHGNGDAASDRDANAASYSNARADIHAHPDSAA